MAVISFDWSICVDIFEHIVNLSFVFFSIENYDPAPFIRLFDDDVGVTFQIP